MRTRRPKRPLILTEEERQRLQSLAHRARSHRRWRESQTYRAPDRHRKLPPPLTWNSPGSVLEIADRLCRKQPLSDGSGHLEVLADEHVVRPTDLDHVDGVRAVAQLQYTVDSASWILGERGGPWPCPRPLPL